MYSVEQLRSLLFLKRAQRVNLENDWAQTLLLVKPNRSLSGFISRQLNSFNSPFASRELNYTRVHALYDNRGATSSAILASYLHSSLTNPHEPWMGLIPSEFTDMTEDGIPDEDLESLKGLEKLGKQCHLEWQASNFHQTMYPFFKSLVDLGTACLTMYSMDNADRDSSLVFNTRSMFNVYFEENYYGMPNTVFCIYQKTAHQLAEFFKTKDKQQFKNYFGASALEALEQNRNDLYNLVHAVYPTSFSSEGSYHSNYFMADFVADATRGSGNKSKPANYDIIKGRQSWAKELKKDFIKTEIVDRNPYIIVRIRRDDADIHGNGFSMECLPLLRQLQYVQRSLTIASQKNTEPPLNMPSNRMRNQYSTVPNHLNPVDIINGNIVTVTPTLPQINLQHPELVKQGISKDIDRTFMVDKIAIENVKYNRTAQEVNKRSAEEIKILSPFLGALESEFLTPLVSKTLKHLTTLKRPKTKDLMQKLAKLDFKLKFISDIARAQMKASTNDMVELMALIHKVGEADPSVKDIISWKKYAYKIVMNFGGVYDTLNMNKKVQDQMQQGQQDGQLTTAEANANIQKTKADALKSAMEAEQVRRGISGL